jgi:hypothetical protein
MVYLDACSSTQKKCSITSLSQMYIIIISFKNSIKSRNIQIWAFLLKFQISLLNRALLLQEYTVKNPIFVFLTSLTHFSTIFWALLSPVIFLSSFGYIFLYIFCGDQKMGYNIPDACSSTQKKCSITSLSNDIHLR